MGGINDSNGIYINKQTNKQIHQKKKSQTKPNKNKQVDTENRVVFMRGEGAKGR